MKIILLLLCIAGLTVMSPLVSHSQTDLPEQGVKKEKQSKKKYYRKASRNFRKGNLEKAYEQAKLAYAQCDQLIASNLLGLIQHGRDKGTSAGHFFQRAAEIGYEDGRSIDTLRWNVGMLLMSEGRHATALDILNQTTAFEENTNFSSQRGLAYFHLGNHQAAITAFKTCITHGGSQHAHFNLSIAQYGANEIEEAINSLEQALTTGDKKSSTYLAKAYCHKQLGQSQLAKKAFQNALKKESDHIHARIGLASMLIQEGNTQGARRQLKKVLDVDPESYEATYLLGNCQMNEQRFAEANQYFETAIEHNPENHLAYIGKGFLHCHLGEYATAQSYFNYALSLNPDSPSALEGIGIASFRIDSLHIARQAFDLLDSEFPNHQLTYDGLVSKGFTLVEYQEFSAANDVFHQGIQVDSKKSNCYNGLACTYYWMNKYDLALVNYNLALERNGDDEIVYTNRGNTLFKMNRFEEALSDFRKALSYNENNQHALNGMGLCLEKLGDSKSAILRLRQATEIDPTNEYYFVNLGSAHGRYAQELQTDGQINEARQQYDSVLVHYNKALTLGIPQSVYNLNLGYIHSILDSFDLANTYFDAIEEQQYLPAVTNNKGVVLALRDDGVYRQEALNIFSKAINYDRQQAAANEFHETYMSPRYNRKIVAQKLGQYTDPSLVVPVIDGEYFYTYYYFALMRNSPPPAEHQVPNAITIHMPDMADDDIEYLLYEEGEPCFVKKQKRKRIPRFRFKERKHKKFKGCPSDF